MTNKDRNALRLYGHKLKDKGYQPIPIPHREKGPRIKKWQDPEYQSDLGTYLSNGYGGDFANVGIAARGMVVLDFDIYDPRLSSAMERFAFNTLGANLMRVGAAPKFMVFLRLDDGGVLKKFTSPKYVSPEGDRSAQIEILGAGQQFLAYGYHPDGHAIEWFDDSGFPCDGLVDLSRDELPEVSIDQLSELIETFNRTLSDEGWTKKNRGSQSFTYDSGDVARAVEGELMLAPKGASATGGGMDFDEFFDSGRALPLNDINVAKAREYLNAIPNDGRDDQPEYDYDEWYRIICGIHHQFGGDEALELALEFSRRSPKHDEEIFMKIWGYINSDRENPITFATVIKEAKPYMGANSANKLGDLSNQLDNVEDRAELDTFCDTVKNELLEPADRELLAKKVNKALKRIEGESIPIGLVRDMLRPEVGGGVTRIHGDYRWCDGWVYVSRLDAFYNIDNSTLLDVASFNRKFGMMLLTDEDRAEGRARNARNPSDVALNIFGVPEAYDFQYCPDNSKCLPEEPYIMVDKGVRYINQYLPPDIDPVYESEWDEYQREAVDVFRSHVLNMTCGGDERDAALLTSWLAHKLKFPAIKIGWAPVLQGVHGTGKSFFFQLADALYGQGNVKQVNPDMIKEKYNSWAQGVILNTVEELRLTGMGKYDAANSLKPIVSNRRMAVRRMREDTTDRDIYNDLLIASNYVDCIPMDHGERRYTMFMSPYQFKGEIEEFKRNNPDYFRFLFGVLDDDRRGILGKAHNIAAISGYLMSYEPHYEFMVGGDAPYSSIIESVKDESMSEAEQIIMDIVNEGGAKFINDNCVVVQAVLRVFADEYYDTREFKKGAVDIRMVVRVLTRMGYRMTKRNPVDQRICLTKYLGNGARHCMVGYKDPAWSRFDSKQIRREVLRSKLPTMPVHLDEDFNDDDEKTDDESQWDFL